MDVALVLFSSTGTVTAMAIEVVAPGAIVEVDVVTSEVSAQLRLIGEALID